MPLFLKIHYTQEGVVQRGVPEMFKEARIRKRTMSFHRIPEEDSHGSGKEDSNHRTGRAE